MSHCLTTTQMAGRLGLTAEVCDPLRQVFTRWDAKGVPDGVGGDEIARPVRLFHLADTVEVFHRAGGVDAAVEVAEARRGKHFDPEVVDLFCGAARDVLADMDAAAELGALIEAEPGLRRQLSEGDLDSALEAVADFTDLRSPSRAGHSRGVAHTARPPASPVRAARRWLSWSSATRPPEDGTTSARSASTPKSSAQNRSSAAPSSRARSRCGHGSATRPPPPSATDRTSRRRVAGADHRPIRAHA
ncbi:MAG TPA: hypothetical protein VGQ26_03610 [Streptosporangiaceae bacterium]|jgi:hypothetical protein|nr:hypothetical protein [Streptosporangiaceae bacterium]